jgi:hypothetical protein
LIANKAPEIGVELAVDVGLSIPYDRIGNSNNDVDDGKTAVQETIEEWDVNAE